MRVRLVMSPSGGGCRHVHITDTAGALLQVTTRDELGAEVSDLESQREVPKMARRVHEFVRRYRLANPAATPAQIRAAVEAEDFGT